MAESLNPGPDSRHIPVVIRAPNIDQHSVTASEFILVISYVCREVSGLASGTDQHTVFFISVIFHNEPQGAFFHFGFPALSKFVQRC